MSINGGAFDDETKGKVRDFFKFARETRNEIARLTAKMDSHPMARKKPRGPRAKLPRCPKCHQRPIEYIELWRDHTMRFGVDEEGRPNEEGNLHDGAPYCVEAECACGHRWRLKGILQITDLEGLTP